MLLEQTSCTARLHSPDVVTVDGMEYSVVRGPIFVGEYSIEVDVDVPISVLVMVSKFAISKAETLEKAAGYVQRRKAHI